MRYLIDLFSPAPSWPEREIVCPWWTADEFYDVGKSAVSDPGLTDKVWGFDTTGKDLTGLPDYVNTARGGIYGDANDWAIIVHDTFEQTEDGGSQKCEIAYIVRVDVAIDFVEAHPFDLTTGEDSRIALDSSFLPIYRFNHQGKIRRTPLTAAQAVSAVQNNEKSSAGVPIFGWNNWCPEAQRYVKPFPYGVENA